MKDNPEESWSKVQFYGEVKDTPAANSPPLRHPPVTACLSRIQSHLTARDRHQRNKVLEYYLA